MQLIEITDGFSLTSFGYHIKTKHDVFSNGKEQKCLRFSQMSLFGMLQRISREKVCHFIATQWDMHDVSFMLSYAGLDVLIFK